MRFILVNIITKIKMELFLLCLLLGNNSALANSDYATKAHNIYQFAQYIEWHGENTALTFCVVGENPFGNQLSQIIANKKINGRSLEFKQIAGNQLGNCDIAFISESKRSELSQVLHSTHHLLTVSDIPDFAEKGGMIEFTKVEGKLRFVINRNAAVRAGIKISSQLLKLAHKIL
ncbi:MAG: hypothetical protein RL368_670 [Pseudomonadota bacterium]